MVGLQGRGRLRAASTSSHQRLRQGCLSLTSKARSSGRYVYKHTPMYRTTTGLVARHETCSAAQRTPAHRECRAAQRTGSAGQPSARGMQGSPAPSRHNAQHARRACWRRQWIGLRNLNQQHSWHRCCPSTILFSPVPTLTQSSSLRCGAPPSPLSPASDVAATGRLPPLPTQSRLSLATTAVMSST